MPDEVDRDLLERFVQGDSAAFELLFRQFERDVFGWILRIVRDTSAAEDALVEAPDVSDRYGHLLPGLEVFRGVSQRGNGNRLKVDYTPSRSLSARTRSRATVSEVRGPSFNRTTIRPPNSA